MSKRFHTSEEVKRIINGREVLEPTSYRKAWTASRLVKLNDGSTLPLLWILAEHKFGAFDPKEKIPFWKDKLCTNETLENVELMEVSAEARPRVNPFGVPAGSPEYMRRYRAANRDKVRLYQRNYYHKLRAAFKEQQGGAPSTTPSVDKSLDKLRAILSQEAIPEDLDRRTGKDRRESE